MIEVACISTSVLGQLAEDTSLGWTAGELAHATEQPLALVRSALTELFLDGKLACDGDRYYINKGEDE